MTLKALVGKLPATSRPDDTARWYRTILGTVLLLVGCAVLLIQVLRGVVFSSWISVVPAGVPIAAGLFLIDAKHLLDAARAVRNKSA